MVSQWGGGHLRIHKCKQYNGGLILAGLAVIVMQGILLNCSKVIQLPRMKIKQTMGEIKRNKKLRKWS